MYVFRKLFNNGPQHVTERFFIDHKPNLYILKIYIFENQKILQKCRIYYNPSVIACRHSVRM